MEHFGFIITRHVNSEKTNKYWNQCIKCIRTHYNNTIIVIDDNSNKSFVKEEFEYKNIQIIQSEFPGAGELLPYYYFHLNKYFKNAVIIHDSVFIHKKINFNKLNLDVLPLWHFTIQKSENSDNSLILCNVLNNNIDIKQNIKKYDFINGLLLQHNNIQWEGCFGVQSFINHSFLSKLQEKYNIFNLLKVVKNRNDRCCLERIMGVLFYKEYPILLNLRGSLFGDISNKSYGYTFEDYCNDIQNNNVKYPFIKVWTGR